MRLPQHLVESPFFQFATAGDVRSAATAIPPADLAEMERLAQLGLPPAVSVDVLALLFGLNSGILWSFRNKPQKYYRVFPIKKGNAERLITAPRIGLKVVQTWMGYHLSRIPMAPHVFGFVPGRSHLEAARQHLGATWALSVDIRDFFPSTPKAKIVEALIGLSYSPNAAGLIADLNTLENRLVQGSPASPALSNLCVREIDAALAEMAGELGCRLTRYADDVTFSGEGEVPATLLHDIQTLLAATPWQLNDAKTELQPLKGRIKIHGLLVKNDEIKLTKGYRNKIRAYSHILKTKRVPVDDLRILSGHLNYANQVNRKNGLPPLISDEELSEAYARSNTVRKTSRVINLIRRLTAKQK